MVEGCTRVDLMLIDPARSVRTDYLHPRPRPMPQGFKRALHRLLCVCKCMMRKGFAVLVSVIGSCRVAGSNRESPCRVPGGERAVVHLVMTQLS